MLECCNINEAFPIPHPFLSAQFSSHCRLLIFFSLLRKEDKDEADGGRKKNERRKRDEEREKQLDFFCTIVPAGVRDQY
jgi:hypothetical protein